jgi:hypothetical protein
MYETHVRFVQNPPRALFISGVKDKNTDVIPTPYRRDTDRGFAC